MNTLQIEMHPVAESVSFSDVELIVSLIDGRTISVPIVWFPSLAGDTKKQLANYELLGDGEGIYWPQLDENLSVNGLLLGT
jgi:hypothetical protein